MKGISTKRAIATNTTAQLIGKAVNTTSSLLVTILIARNFGANYYGDFTKAFVTATLFFVGIDFGINAVIVRRTASGEADEQDEFRNALGLRFLLALASLVILLVFVLLVPTADDQGYPLKVKLATLIFGLTFFEHASFTTANAIFQRRLQYIKSAIASSLGSLVVLGAVLIAISAKADVRGIAIAHLLGSIVMMTVALIFVRNLIGKISPTFVWKKMKVLLQETLPIGTMLVLNILTTRIGTIMLALSRTSGEVGLYGLAYRAFDVILVFPTFFMNATYPIMIKRYKESPHRLIALVKKSAMALVAISLLAGLLLFIASPLLTIIREEFTNAQIPLRILSLALPFFFLTSLMQWTLVTTRKEKTLIPIYAGALIINFLANLLFIPRYGMLAAAVNTGVTEAIILFLTAAAVLQSFRQSTKEKESYDEKSN